MIRATIVSIRVLLVMTVLTGVLYPLTVTVIARLVFPDRAEGSLIREGGAVLGSDAIGQSFSRPEYFWGRLSATSRMPYDASASSGTNYGPLHPDLKKAAEGRIAALKTHPVPDGAIPADLVTASASGLDPHISPAAAEYQVRRVASARGISEEAVREVVRLHSSGRFLGILGEPRVHVLRLNLALDRMKSER
ncbi:potassium-transporting ATPase subunit KdpC [bacterium]|nr:potassium-transporting ATPase subunit KdpC [bacterium]